MGEVSLAAGSWGCLVADTAVRVASWWAISRRTHAFCWSSSYRQVYSEELDSLEEMPVRVSVLDHGVGDNEVHYRAVQEENSRWVEASLHPGSFGVGVRRHVPPTGTIGCLVSVIESQAPCPEGLCRSHHAEDD
jgi:hypothetical protein